MVYESDFYTTRRPYSRPLVSSYSVTHRPITLPISTILQLRSMPRMPYVAHKRLVTVIHTPYHTVYHGGSLIPIRVHARVRPSVLAAEINRIRHLTRPSTESYTEKYLQSKDHIYFDDEAKEIRARVDSLLRRVHVFIPRAVASDFVEEIIPERMRSGDYVHRLLSGKQNEKKYTIEPVSWYEIPDRCNFGNLACMKFVGGKPQSIRKPYFKVADLRPSDIKNDVNFLSYYSKNREAAANASPDLPMTDRELRKARALQPDVDEITIEREVKSEKKVEPKSQKKRGSKREKPEVVNTSVVENVATPEPAEEAPLKCAKEEEPELLISKVAEPVIKTEPLIESEPIVDLEPVIEHVKIPEPLEETEFANEVKLEMDAEEQFAKELESENLLEPMKEPETGAEETEQVQSEVTAAAEEQSETKAKEENTSEIGSIAPAVETVSGMETEVEADNVHVKQEKEEAVKRIEQYLIKAAEEARTDEERKQAAEEERIKLEVEERKAWEVLQAAQERATHLDEILEQEKAEVQRKAEEEKVETERLETERILEMEKKITEAKTMALLEEQERQIVEEQLEKAREKEEQEERLANVTFDDTDDVKDHDHSCDDVVTCDVTDQEKEERPYDPVTDDDTRIEEETIQEEEHFEMNEDPFVEEPEGAESKPEGGANNVEETQNIEEVTSGGEESFEWGDEDA